MTTGSARDGRWPEWIEELRPHLPDPYAPLDRVVPTRTTNVRTIRQRRQRAVILSGTRRIVAEAGIEHAHLDAIAAHAGVSIQTLYNQIGSRHDILGAAATEWVFALGRAGIERARQIDGNVIFTTLELFWAGAVIHQAYNGAMVRSRAHQSFMRQPFLKSGKLAIVSQLRELRAAGLLVPWADPGLVAEALARACHTHIGDWLSEPYDLARFRALLVNDCGLLLRGALAGAEVARLERRLDAAAAP